MATRDVLDSLGLNCRWCGATGSVRELTFDFVPGKTWLCCLGDEVSFPPGGWSPAKYTVTVADGRCLSCEDWDTYAIHFDGLKVIGVSELSRDLRRALYQLLDEDEIVDDETFEEFEARLAETDPRLAFRITALAELGDHIDYDHVPPPGDFLWLARADA